MLNVVFIGSDRLYRRFTQFFDNSGVSVHHVHRRKWRTSGFASSDVRLIFAERKSLPVDGHKLRHAVRGTIEHSLLVIISASNNPDDHLQLLAAGCAAVLFEGGDEKLLQDAIKSLIGRVMNQRNRAQLANLSIRDDRFPGDVFRALTPHNTPPKWRPLSEFKSLNPEMKSLLKTSRRVASSDSTLLLLGETGVGKETIARGIHLDSPRKSQPFLAVNCAAINEQLLESELFGHQAGSFTGANQLRRGAFELADGGTLLLDEIGDMPLHLQVKLLRVVQDKSFYRVGGEQQVHVDVRLMAATNADLKDLVARKMFRRDLYHRLAVVTLLVPPLRNRREDILTLANGYVEMFCRQMSKPAKRLSSEANSALIDHHWPGNVRELINVIERAVLLSDNSEITEFDLALEPLNSTPQRVTDSTDIAADNDSCSDPLSATWHEAKQEALNRFERSYLEQLLHHSNGQLGLAARRAGLNPRTLYAKMNQYGLSKKDYRN